MTSDIGRELRATRPAAPDRLRDHVRELAAREPERRPPLLARIRVRRSMLLALPATAIAVAAVAGVVGLSQTPTSRDAAPMATEDSTITSGAIPTSPQAKSAAGSIGSGAATAIAGGTTRPQATPSANAGTSAPGPTPGRAQRYEAQLAIEVDDTDALSAATQKALSTVRALGGYVVSTSYAAGESGNAQLTLRVPTRSVQEAVVTLSSLGRIVSQRVQIDDLQTTLDETDKRIATLGEQIARITARLESTTLDDETRAALEARRGTARQERAELRAQRAATAGEAALATIQLSLSTPGGESVVPAPPSRIDRALDDASSILVWEATGVLYILAIAGPLALLGAGAWLLNRALRRRAEERLLA